MGEAIDELKKIRELNLDPAQLEQLSTHVQEQLAQLEEFPKSIREWIQQLADSQMLQVHAEDVVSSTKSYLYENIARFQSVPTLKEAINCYSNMVYLVKRFLPFTLFKTHQGHITNFKDTHITLLDKYGINALFPRSIMPEIYEAFYEIFAYLLNTRLITEAEVKKSMASYTEERDQALKQFGGAKK